MNKEFYKPELLAPAGSVEALKASVNAGADAVYMGGKMFGARAYADNPDTEGILEALEFCHLRNKKLYLTINTLLKEEELFDRLYAYLAPLYEAGLDAVIVQDIGVMNFIGECFKGLDIHVSTQCSLTMAEGAKALKSLVKNPESITRIVPARELSIEELKSFRKDTDLEMEVFIHGALCYCYSGQCLLSSLAGGRSGNRGRCAQPCRRIYTAEIDGKDYSGYLLSPKDMCGMDYIRELVKTGIDSFKIEGRMKSAEYAAGVVEAYRRIIDDTLQDMEKEKETVSELYNRGGFNSGYFMQHNGKDMMSTERAGHNGVLVGSVSIAQGRKAVITFSKTVEKGDVLEIRDAAYEFTAGSHLEKGGSMEVLTMKDSLPQRGMKVYRTKNQSLIDSIDEKYLKKNIKCPVDIRLECLTGRNLTLEMGTSPASGLKETKVTVTGAVVEKAINSKTSEESLKTQVSKLGNTDFYAYSVEIKADDVFVPVGELNRLRREAAELLREKIIEAFKRKPVTPCLYNREGTENSKLTTKPSFSAHARTAEQLKAIIDTDKTGIISDIYLDMDETAADKALELCGKAGKSLYFVLPRIVRKNNYLKAKAFCEKYRDRAGFLVQDYEALSIVKETGVLYRTDSSLYVFNTEARGLFEKEFGFKSLQNVKNGSITGGFTVPVELNRKEIASVADENGELIVYGLLPVMVSAQCIYKTVTGECRPHGLIRFKDGKGFTFTDEADCKNCTNIIYNSMVLNLLHRFDEVMETGCGRYRLHFTHEEENEIRLVIYALETVLSGKMPVFPEEIMGLGLTNGHFSRGVE